MLWGSIAQISQLCEGDIWFDNEEISLHVKNTPKNRNDFAVRMGDIRSISVDFPDEVRTNKEGDVELKCTGHPTNRKKCVKYAERKDKGKGKIKNCIDAHAVVDLLEKEIRKYNPEVESYHD